MDAKDLRTEAALGNRSNDGNSKYLEASVLQANSNKTYHDIGSNSLGKVEVQAARPCAVIGPDRVVPPPAPLDAYIKKASVEPWPGPETTYRRPPEYPHKLPDYNHPSRNISPRQTFQENMQRFMLPPSYNSTKLKEDHNFPVDANGSPIRNKLSGSAEGKYCEVPYVVSPLASEQKNIRSVDVSVSNNNPTLSKSAPHGWLPTSANVRPAKPYGAPEVYQYPEYQNCAGPRPMLVPRSHRTVHEESGHMYTESYYQDANLPYKPYPGIKERYPQARYEYVGNYSNPFHPPPPFPSHKYDMQKQLPPHPFSYSQAPLKYMDTRMAEPTINGYQRPINPHINFNPVAYHNQMIHSQYGPVPGNCFQANKFYPYPPDKSPTVNKPQYDTTTHKSFGKYENVRGKPYHMSETYYVNEMMRPHPVKAAQVMPPNYQTVGMHGMPPHPYYRKDNPTIMNYENNPHYRNIDPSISLNASMLSRLPSQFSPNAIAISPSESNTSNDTAHTLGTSQEDCGYVSQSSSASMRSVDSGLYRMQGDFYRRYDYRYGSIVKSLPSSKTNVSSNTNLNSKNKKNIDLRQYLQMWNEGEDENGETNNKEITLLSSSNTREIINLNGNTKQEQLYVLGLVNVPSEELSKYEHIQKVSKLPENIKGYNSIELLNQFEEVIESSNLNNYCSKPPTPKSFQFSSLKSSPMQSIRIPSRPLSPLDVEAKISQSVIHKEVGCNFEIKPCSPKMLNVEVATPIQTVLGERVIEKVNNPVSEPSPILNRVDNVVSDCEIIKHQDHRISFNDNTKASSCKMVSSQYTSSENATLVKSNYSLHDLESNSGVCLASLPRLDNDIELTFPEVNQQFINANKVESVITQTTTQQDLPQNLDQSEFQPEIEFKQLLPVAEPEKEFSKLSKYRKRRRNSDSKEDIEFNVQSIRTNSVIIKNPENIKCLENSTTNFENNSIQDAQQDPINLTVSDSWGNPNTSDCNSNANTTNTCQDLTTINDSENSSTEIDTEEFFSGKNQDMKKDECCKEESIGIHSIIAPDSSKSKNNIVCAVEKGLQENKFDSPLEISGEPVLVEENQIYNYKSDRMINLNNVNFEDMVNSKQNNIKEASNQEDPNLDDVKIKTETSDCFQLSVWNPSNKINVDDKKVSLKLGINKNNHEISPKNYNNDEPADQELSVNNPRSLDNEIFKDIGVGSSQLKGADSNCLAEVKHENLNLPDATNGNEPGMYSVNESKHLKYTTPETRFASNVGLTQQKECSSQTKLYKELFSPRIQNLILFIEGNPNNPLKERNSDTVFYASMQLESAETKLHKCCLDQTEFDSNITTEYPLLESFEKKSENKQLLVPCNVNFGQDISEQAVANDSQFAHKDLSDLLTSNNAGGTNEESNKILTWNELVKLKKSVKFLNDDNSEPILTTSGTIDSDTCDDLSDIEDERNKLSPQTAKDLSVQLNATVFLSTDTDVKENTQIELETNNNLSEIMNTCKNDEHVVLTTESSEKTDFESSLGKDPKFKMSYDIVEEAEDKSKVAVKRKNDSNKDKCNVKESMSIHSVDNSRNEGTQKWKKNVMSESKDLLQMQCESSVNLVEIGDNKQCTHFPENSDFLFDFTNNIKKNILKEIENKIPKKKYDEVCQKPIENEAETNDRDGIDLQCKNNAQLDNLNCISNLLLNLKDRDSCSSSSDHKDICSDNLHFAISEEYENSNKSFHGDNASEPNEDIMKKNHVSKTSQEKVAQLQIDLYSEEQKTNELTCNDLANRKSIKLEVLNVNNRRTKSLKRCLSDSDLNACNISQEDQDNIFFLNKRKKQTEPETLHPQFIKENCCNIIQNNRRNSISSMYTEENVSFCILIDKNCILTEGSDKFCYTEIPEHCLSCIESDGNSETMEENTELIPIQDELNYENCENLALNNDDDEKDLQETWVEDIACVETVVSDEVAEDIVVTDLTSPIDMDVSEDDNGIFNINEHTDKVKYIYGDKMCTDDAHLVETLYRTPQMDVNKTLVYRESQGIDDCHQYYDEESLEKLLSESTNFQTETGCSLSVLSPSCPSPSFGNTDTGLNEKPDLEFNEELLNLSKNSSQLTEVVHFDNNSFKTQDDTVHSCKTSVDDVFSDQVKETLKNTTSSSPEVSSTTSEERNSTILLKITNLGGSRVAQVNSFDANQTVTNVSCKYTEKKDYAKSHNSLLPNRPLITKAAQKYIPPLKETIRDLKVKLTLPHQSLIKLKELKISKEEPKLDNSINKHYTSNCVRKGIPKKIKPKFEDVLKSIDELQFKMHKEKSKKNKKLIPKVVIKKNENGSHYTSMSNKDKYNPDLTGRKWQPWVFMEKNHFVDQMALMKKTKAVFSHRKNTFILSETFKKYKSISNAKFVISQPVCSESSTGKLKYTIRLKHNY